MPATDLPRTTLIARTAQGLIAERGLRGLTHRAVDEAAGLPPGSTSYHARTRARLIEITLESMADAEAAGYIVPAREAALHDPEMLAELIAEFLYSAIKVDTARMVARFELALEATRRPELRRHYDRFGHRFRELAHSVVTALGSAAPERHARTLVSWADGTMFDSIAGAGAAVPPTKDELRASAAEILRSIQAGPISA